MLYKLLLIITFSFSSLSGQSYTCFTCSKEIIGNYVNVQGKYFHPDHFICSYCRKVIDKEYMYDDSKFYHNDCFSKSKGLICDFCKDLINEEYIIQEDKKFHKKCYEFISPKCKVCFKVLDSYYTKDDFGNQYHSSHLQEFPKCFSCGRLICKSITYGGKKYPDGRNLCNICSPMVIFDQARISGLYNKVLLKLNSLGIKINSTNVSVTGVSLTELKKESGIKYSGNMKGICHYTSESGFGNYKYSNYKVFVLNGLLPLNIESVIAHELMHIWFYQNTNSGHSKMLLEGSCNYASYLYLLSLNDPNTKRFISDLEKDATFAYGEGFKYVKNMFANKTVNDFLSFIKKNKS